MRRSAEPGQGLTAMLLGSNVGCKLLSDATKALEDRCVDTEMTAQLEEVFAKLPTTYTDMSGEVSAKDMHLCICLACLFIYFIFILTLT